jgi:hypothetical protein
LIQSTEARIPGTSFYIIEMLENFGTHAFKAGIEAGFKSLSLRALKEHNQLFRPPFTTEKKDARDKARVTVEPVVIDFQSQRLPLICIPEACRVTTRAAMRTATDKKEEGNLVGNFLEYNISKGIAHHSNSARKNSCFKHI